MMESELKYDIPIIKKYSVAICSTVANIKSRHLSSLLQQCPCIKMSEMNMPLLKQTTEWGTFQVHLHVISHPFCFNNSKSIFENGCDEAKKQIISDHISKKEMICKFVTVMMTVRYKMYLYLHPENICVNVKCCNL